MSTDKGRVLTLDFSAKSTAHTAAKVIKLSNEERELNESKRALFDEWLRAGEVLVQLDGRRAGLKLPEHLLTRSEVRLNFCFDYSIPDFNYNEQSIWATLSFGGQGFFCVVPWTAVYGMQSEALAKGAAWVQCFPRDLGQRPDSDRDVP